MTVNYLEQAAELVGRGRLEGRAMEALPEHLRPASPADAYALQRALHRRYRSVGLGHVAGYKIGCTTRVMQEYLGIDHPCAGGILARSVHHGDSELPHEDFCRVGVECEVAVRLSDHLPRRDEPWTRDEVASAVGEVMAAIEIVDDRWRDYTRIDAFTLTADDFFGAGCVLGEPVAFRPDMDLAALTAGMSINDEPVGRGTGTDVMGHPLEALTWLASNDTSGDGLHAGELVLLGSLVATRWLARGDRAAIAVDGLAPVGVRFG